MTLEEKCYLLSGKDFWQTRSVERLGVPNMTLSDGPHGIRKQAGEGDQLGLNPSLPATCFPTAATVANSGTRPWGRRSAPTWGRRPPPRGCAWCWAPA